VTDREQVADPRPVSFDYLGLAEGVLSDYHGGVGAAA